MVKGGQLSGRPWVEGLTTSLHWSSWDIAHPKYQTDKGPRRHSTQGSKRSYASFSRAGQESPSTGTHSTVETNIITSNFPFFRN
eukprot:2507683-Amphidinium_carterae.1